MGNAWGAGHHTGLADGLAMGEQIGRAMGQAAGLKKGVAIGVVASAVVVAATVGLRKLEPWNFASKHLMDRDQDSAVMDTSPVNEKGVDDKREAGEGIPSE